MGAAVNQNAVSKVMLCFTLAPHKSHRAWHLSGCRSETRYAAPLTQTPRPLGRWRGWLVSCLLQKWGHFILLGLWVFFFFLIKCNKTTGNEKTVKETHVESLKERNSCRSFWGKWYLYRLFIGKHEKPTVLMTDRIVKTPAVLLTPS